MKRISSIKYIIILIVCVRSLFAQEVKIIKVGATFINHDTVTYFALPRETVIKWIAKAKAQDTAKKMYVETFVEKEVVKSDLKEISNATKSRFISFGLSSFAGYDAIFTALPPTNSATIGLIGSMTFLEKVGIFVSPKLSVPFMPLQIVPIVSIGIFYNIY